MSGEAKAIEIVEARWCGEEMSPKMSVNDRSSDGVAEIRSEGDTEEL